MQQHKKIQKNLLDIDSIIEELDKILDHHKRDFTDFQRSFISVRAVERDLMIIGEAINKIPYFEREMIYIQHSRVRIAWRER